MQFTRATQRMRFCACALAKYVKLIDAGPLMAEKFIYEEIEIDIG